MVRQVPERYYYFGWWLVTLSLRLGTFATYLSFEVAEEETIGRLELEANIYLMPISSMEGEDDDDDPRIFLTLMIQLEKNVTKY